MASANCPQVIRIPVLRWAALVRGLRARGAGSRESGAFLLGRRKPHHARVLDYRMYDDLDPDALDSGAIEFHAAGFSTLWAYCRVNDLEVLADVHTHPGEAARQSGIDRRNPMMPMRGHVAIILPHFANISSWSLSRAGIYEYQGNYEWEQCNTEGHLQRVKLSLW